MLIGAAVAAGQPQSSPIPAPPDVAAPPADATKSPSGLTWKVLAKPKGTVAPTTKQPDGPLGENNTVMTTGVTNGATRPSVGDHATPPIQAQPTVIAVTTERTTTTTTTPAPEPVAAPAPEPAPQPEPAAAPMPEPRADRN